MDVPNVLSLALLIVTATYVVLTWRIARDSGRAAESSRIAATASREAAEASLRSAVVAEAQLAVKFIVDVHRHDDGAVWLYIEPNANVVLVSARLRCSVLIEKGGAPTAYEAELDCPPTSSEKLPMDVNAGQPFSLSWPEPHYRLTDYGIFGFAMIEYSLSLGAQTRIKSEYFEFPKNVGIEMLNRFGQRESARAKPKAVNTNTAEKSNE